MLEQYLDVGISIPFQQKRADELIKNAYITKHLRCNSLQLYLQTRLHIQIRSISIRIRNLCYIPERTLQELVGIDQRQGRGHQFFIYLVL